MVAVILIPGEPPLAVAAEAFSRFLERASFRYEQTGECVRIVTPIQFFDARLSQLSLLFERVAVHCAHANAIRASFLAHGIRFATAIQPPAAAVEGFKADFNAVLRLAVLSRSARALVLSALRPILRQLREDSVPDAAVSGDVSRAHRMWAWELTRAEALQSELNAKRDRAEALLRAQAAQRAATVDAMQALSLRPEQAKLESRTMKMIGDLIFALDDMHRDLSQDW
jgi:hypothetical protein